DAANQQYVAWTPNAPDDGFSIEGAKGYIVNLPTARDIVFTGTGWTNQTQVPTAPLATIPYQTWAFVVSGHLEGSQQFDDYFITVRNHRTKAVMKTQVRSNYFAAATADLNYRSVIEVGDTLELVVTDTQGNVVSEKFNFTVNAANLANAVLSVRLTDIGTPKQNLLLQNYPNPFNPETWIPYRLSEAGPVSLSIYDTAGELIRTLSLGYQLAGFYENRERAIYWDGRNTLGETVASGVYFYQLVTPSFQQTRRMLILK
ncbi:MAG: T9SS type A sorting domain-containing protein, partial [Candidatus Poribacteria bacterium]|nr:T9SS type A sorting domain-containing protein [Candidatus Poribacteria bacterium]